MDGRCVDGRCVDGRCVDGRAWILERGWVVCGRLIRGGVMCRTRLSWYWSAWMQSPRSSGVVSDDVLLGEVGTGEPSTISNIAVAVGVMEAISWFQYKLFLSINLHTKTSFVILHVTYFCFFFQF